MCLNIECDLFKKCRVHTNLLHLYDNSINFFIFIEKHDPNKNKKLYILLTKQTLSIYIRINLMSMYVCACILQLNFIFTHHLLHFRKLLLYSIMKTITYSCTFNLLHKLFILVIYFFFFTYEVKPLRKCWRNSQSIHPK